MVKGGQRLFKRATAAYCALSLALLLYASQSTQASTPFGNNPELGDGNYTPPSGSEPSERNKNGSPRRQGEWGPRAQDELKTSNGLISTQEAAASSAAAAAARNVQCNGATCSTAADVSRLAYTAARGVQTTASSRLIHADEVRKQMLQQLSSGRYTLEEVSRVRELLKENPTPKEEEIATLPRKVQDIARGLATNYREMKMLDEKRNQYNNVAAGAQNISQKLKGNAARAETILPTAHDTKYSAKFGRSGENTPSSSSITGRKSYFSSAGGIGSSLTSLIDKTSDEQQGRKRFAPSTASSHLPVKEEDKPLSGKNLDLIAGMMSELDYDLKTNLASALDGNGEPAVGNGLPESMPEGVDESSVLGGAILAQVEPPAIATGANGTAAKGNALRDRSPSSITLHADLDFLGADKDLFKRVNEQMRRRAGGELKAN